MHTKGLTTAEAESRFKQFGLNQIQEKRKTPLILQFLAQFKDFMVIILICASIVAYFVGEGVDALIIIGIVMLNATIGFGQGYKAEKAVEALKKLLSPKARVVRDGIEVMIDAHLLVPGDVVMLAEGDKISADGELFEENELFVDESVLTGESISVKKDAAHNKKIFMGTQVSQGTGRAVIIKTGMATKFGEIAMLTSETKKDKSPLQKELEHLGGFVGKVTLGIAVVLFIIGIAQGRGVIQTLLFAVSLAVAAVPEGLPATITVALALGVQRLARENAIVKQLSSVETLGSTTVICTDKTGTLTKNEMTVQEMSLPNYDISVHGVGYEPRGTFSFHHYGSTETDYFQYEKGDRAHLADEKKLLYGIFERTMQAAVLCNNAALVIKNEREAVSGIVGDPTEAALLTAAEKAGFSINQLLENYKRISEVPFDSGRKRMSVVTQEVATGALWAWVKGAPETLLPLCTIIFQNGHFIPLTKEEKEVISGRSEKLAARALRTIAVAYKKIDNAEGTLHKKYTKEEVESDLVFLGLFGIADPPREDVKEAIALTHKAGIRVFVITGDHGLTAHAVAKELGITKNNTAHIVTGDMLEHISEEKLTALLAPGEETIFARVNPADKLRIVNSLKKRGEVVAVTGDGVNDAPALKRADIGIAMGITGTDVSKEAANIVLADDSFATIVTAVIEGRTIYENMKKFIYFIFSSNIGEVLCVFLAIMLRLPAPLTAIFLLIINTLTDVFPSLALAVEPVERTVLEKSPRRPEAKIMEWPFIRRCLAAGLWIGVVTIGAFVWSLLHGGWHFGEPIDINSMLYREAATVALVALTMLQMVHSWNSRSEVLSVFSMRLFSNIWLIAAIVFSLISTIAIVYIPFLQTYLKTAPLDVSHVLMLAAVSFSILIFEEIRKIFTRRQLHRVSPHQPRHAST